MDVVLVETVFDTLTQRRRCSPSARRARRAWESICRSSCPARSPTRRAARCRARRPRRSGIRSVTCGRRRSASIARSAANSCVLTSRSSRASPTPMSAPIRTRARRTPLANTRSPRRETAEILRGIRRKAASQHGRAVAAAPRPTTSARVANAVGGHRAARTADDRAGVPPQRSRAAHHRCAEPVRQCRRAHQRHGLGEVPKIDRGGRLRAAVEIARQQVANGAQIIDVNMDEGMLDSQAAMDQVSEPDRRRARYRARAGHDRFLEMVGDRGGSEVRAGQGDRQLDQPQGGRGACSSSTPARSCATARRSWSWHSTRRGQADTVERKVAICERAYKLLTESVGFAPEDIIFDPNIFAVATGHRGTQPLQPRLHRGHRRDQARACRPCT